METNNTFSSFLNMFINARALSSLVIFSLCLGWQGSASANTNANSPPPPPKIQVFGEPSNSASHPACYWYVNDYTDGIYKSGVYNHIILYNNTPYTLEYDSSTIHYNGQVISQTVNPETTNAAFLACGYNQFIYYKVFDKRDNQNLYLGEVGFYAPTESSAGEAKQAINFSSVAGLSANFLRSDATQEDGYNYYTVNYTLDISSTPITNSSKNDVIGLSNKYTSSFSNVQVTTILPYGKACNDSPSWACTDNKTNGIYRINFSYDLTPPNGVSIAQFPPVVGPFEVQDADGTLLGTVKRNYSFMYIDRDTNTLSLKSTFVYVRKYNDSNSTIYLQGGYEAKNTFYAVSSKKAIDLSAAESSTPAINVQGPDLYYNYNESFFSGNYIGKTIPAYLFSNGLHQMKIRPILCQQSSDPNSCLGESEGSYINPVDATNSKQSNYQSALVYNHIVYVENTSSIVSNYVPATPDDIIYSEHFQDSYLRSRYYCTQAGETPSQINGCGQLNTSETMTSYPPTVTEQRPQLPIYLSFRPDNSKLSLNLAVCYIYYDKKNGVVYNCTDGDNGNNDNNLLVQSELGSTNFANTTNSLSIAFKYQNGEIQPVDSSSEEVVMSVIDPFSLIAGSAYINGWNTNKTINCRTTTSKLGYAIVNYSGGDSDQYQSVKNNFGSFDARIGEPVDSNPVNLIISHGDKQLSSDLTIDVADTGKVIGGSDPKTLNDYVCQTSGWPWWDIWVGNQYPESTLGTQPFLLINNSEDVNNTTYGPLEVAYNHFGLSNYSGDNLIPPLPASITPNSFGLEKSVFQNLACSYPEGSTDTDNASIFADTWCEYLANNGTSITAYGTPMDDSVPGYDISMQDAYVSGIRDVFGNFYPTKHCQISTGTCE